MSQHDAAREIARALSQVLGQALADDAPTRTIEAARDLAQMLSLRGLERLLVALERGEDGRWPDTFRPAVDRVRRGALECERDGSVDALRRADGELGALAHALETLAMSRAAAAARTAAIAAPIEPGLLSASESVGDAASATLTVTRALQQLRIAGADTGERLDRLRLKPAIAARSPAALDVLAVDDTHGRPLHVASDGAALEVTCEGPSFGGLGPAGDVIASLGANLAPARGRPGAWTIRVPLHEERATYLILEQGDVGLAIPWHAVTRVRMVSEDMVAAWKRGDDPPVLPAFSPAAAPSGDRPAVLVGLGLKRAWLVADRLVWRMAADPAHDVGPSPSPSLSRAVRTEDGADYWIVDPQRLLREVKPPSLPTLSGPVRAQTPTSADVPPTAAVPTPPAAPPVRPAGPPPPIRFPVERLIELRREDVEPLAGSPIAEPRKPAAPAPAAPVTATAAPAAPAAARHALVAEDSITARTFLVRLLEQQGFDVFAVGTARELHGALRRGAWALVAVDVDLPDARGPEFVAAVGQASARLATAPPMVALVRDADDEAVAHASGVHITLRKPFAREDVERVLRTLGLGAERG
jgi:CheY-like chemotaxis protein